MLEMYGLDRETRGIIESGLDSLFQELNFLDTASWVLEADDWITSQEDLVLGYFLGAAMMWTNEVLEKEKISKEYKKRLERIEKKDKEPHQKEEKSARKRVRPYRIEVPFEEKEGIKDILRLRINPFRKKIRKELALRRTSE